MSKINYAKCESSGTAAAAAAVVAAAAAAVAAAAAAAAILTASSSDTNKLTNRLTQMYRNITALTQSYSHFAKKFSDIHFNIILSRTQLIASIKFTRPCFVPCTMLFTFPAHSVI
jgi:azurin